MTRRLVGFWFALVLVAAAASDASAASLRGSPASMVEQNRVAKGLGLAFYQTPDEIHAAVARGELVELRGDANFEVADFVRFPFVQPELLVFVERLSAQYRSACGQKLVVTSAVRPSSGQPSNAHQLSVHPAGMAVDLRVSDRAECRDWLEGTLLSLESRGVLNGIREFHPPHYHVAVYPEQYMAYVEEVDAARAAADAAAERMAAAVEELPAVAGFVADEAAPADPDTESGNGLVIAIALLLALPIGFAARRRRRR